MQALTRMSSAVSAPKEQYISHWCRDTSPPLDHVLQGGEVEQGRTYAHGVRRAERVGFRAQSARRHAEAPRRERKEHLGAETETVSVHARVRASGHGGAPLCLA
jgi:hypothetical protein